MPIQASPQKVWSILTDFERYPEWNPFITSITGKPEVETKLTVRMQPPGGNSMTFRPTVLVAEPNIELRWIGHLFITGLFDGEHIFEIVSRGSNSCTFIHREQFSGILVPLFARLLDNGTRKGFELMNEKLKERCERQI